MLVSKIDMRVAICLMVIPEFILMPAMFFAIDTNVFWIAVVGMCLATIPHSMFYGAIAGILARAFPTKIRYTGLSLAYQLCSLLIGGGTPVLAQYLFNSSGSIVGVAIVSGLYAAVSLVCTLALLNRTGYQAGQPSKAEAADEAEMLAAAEQPRPTSSRARPTARGPRGWCQPPESLARILQGRRARRPCRRL